MGDRHARELEVAQNFDFSIGRKHSMRAGVLLEAGWWDSNQRSNAFGTYTFTSLDAFNAGLPSTYAIRIGDPLVDYTQFKAGWFLQDDFRPAKTLQLSVGLRQEIQTQVDSKWNFAPRAAFTWNATKKTTVRGGYGIFYDWYDSSLYEQTIRVDGNHQVDVIVQNPGFPVIEGGGTRLPASIIRSASLDQPLIQQASVGLERPLAAWADFRTDYMWTRGSNTLRSINVNAPTNGVRPDPTVGNITEIQSSGKRASDRFTVALNARYVPRRILGMVMYQYTNSRNFADMPTALPSNSLDPDADWGPSAQDVRHRIFFNFNTPLGNGVRLGVNVQGSSALPYNITTGLDNNGDTVFNDRGDGVGRNSARGATQWTTNIRVNKSIGLGGPRSGAPNAPLPPPPPPTGGGAMNQRVGGGPGGPGGGDGPQMVVMEGGTARYRLDIFVNLQNAFNNVNYNAFIGNQLSPFFGTPTSAAAPRRIEIGFSLGSDGIPLVGSDAKLSRREGDSRQEFLPDIFCKSEASRGNRRGRRHRRLHRRVRARESGRAGPCHRDAHAGTGRDARLGRHPRAVHRRPRLRPAAHCSAGAASTSTTTSWCGCATTAATTCSISATARSSLRSRTRTSIVSSDLAAALGAGRHRSALDRACRRSTISNRSLRRARAARC